jgi:cytochrome c-type biogenesis protein CcmF
MIPELGHLALIIAFVIALLQCILPLWGAHKQQAYLISLARPAAYTQFLFILIAFACLISAFINNDFSVTNVAENSNASLPVIYRICAAWGSHEGSILMWALMLAGWGCAVALFSKHLPDVILARTLGVMGFISSGTLLFTIATSIPFLRNDYSSANVVYGLCGHFSRFFFSDCSLIVWQT